MRQASIFLVEDEALVRMALAAMVEDLGHRVIAEAHTMADAGQYAMTAVQLSLLRKYGTPRRGHSVPHPACGGAMLMLLRVPF